ncbi:hypothetical protein [Maricaulis sp.]|uniref:hypothetical protein n=1 Tax=Maricaulis sp. TaxID=1486257 RepID=UPI001B134BDE|nr:hypothetical protein [Maricaulis sp.]MBO6798028.1 hypothetical protein [Maricaulis sp.]
MRIRVLAAASCALAVSACATTATSPACRAPAPHEMQAFMAVISHNSGLLAQQLAPGAVADAFAASDPQLTSHIWGSQGVTRGSVVGVLSRPPLCVIDDPRSQASDAERQILVYPQNEYQSLRPAEGTPLELAPAFPYGVERADYISCRFSQTASGWKLADACGFRGYTPAVTG